MATSLQASSSNSKKKKVAVDDVDVGGGLGSQARHSELVVSVWARPSLLVNVKCFLVQLK